MRDPTTVDLITEKLPSDFMGSDRVQCRNARQQGGSGSGRDRAGWGGISSGRSARWLRLKPVDRLLLEFSI